MRNHQDLIKENPGTRILKRLESHLDNIRNTLADGIGSDFNNYIEKLRFIMHDNLCAPYYEAGSNKRIGKYVEELV